MLAQPSHGLEQRRLGAGHGSPLAQRAQVLAGIEAEAPQPPDPAYAPSFVAGAVRLGGVLDDPQPVVLCQLEQRVEIGRLAVEMHGNDPHRARPDRGAHRGGIDRHRPLVDVHEADRTARLGDRLGRGDEGVGGGDDFITRSQAEGNESEPQRIGPAVHADTPRSLTVGRELPLEALHFGPADELSGAQRTPERRHQRLFQRQVWPHQVQERNRSRLAHGAARRMRAGFPATITPSGTSLVTTAPAPTIALAPIVTPGRITAPLPIAARRLTRIGSSFQSLGCFAEPSALTAVGQRSFRKVTLWPTKTSSSMLTPSQMNVWLWILQRAPTRAPFWISTNVPISVSSPIVQP